MIDFRQYQVRGNLFFLRHGQSTGNVARVAQGTADFPLSPRGQEQAAAAGHWLSDKEVDLILTSPLLRARQTAEIIATQIGSNGVDARDELTELDIGPFTGLTWAGMAESHPHTYRRFQRYSWDGVPGAEASDAVYQRAEAVWELLLGRMVDGHHNLLAVTHSGLLQWIIKASLGNRHWLPLFPMRNASIFHFRIQNQTIPADDRVSQATPAFYYAWELMGHQV